VFDPHQKSTGRDYSMTFALLMGGLLIVPVLLIASPPLASWALALAAACSLSCVGLAWMTWRRHSRLTIPTLEDERAAAE
jgi:hypothetical protein